MIVTLNVHTFADRNFRGFCPAKNSESPLSAKVYVREIFQNVLSAKVNVQQKNSKTGHICKIFMAMTISSTITVTSIL